jgi:hypothetical protein
LVAGVTRLLTLAVPTSGYSQEKSFASIALGRKNYLFAGSNVGGERAAAINSLIETVKFNGLDLEI